MGRILQVKSLIPRWSLHVGNLSELPSISNFPRTEDEVGQHTNHAGVSSILNNNSQFSLIHLRERRACTEY